MKILLTFIILSLSTFLFSEEKAIEKRIYQATRVNPHPPEIDGESGDVIWKKSIEGDNFIQIEPDEGKAPSQPTTFKIAYDEENLYILIRSHDTEADKIVQRVTRRDKGEDADLVSVLIDSYFDKLTAFEFSVNAAGVKIDGIWSDDGSNRDYSWDPIWYVATSVDDEGWTAEMQIPFSQLRFGKKDAQVWGLEIGRYLFRKQEWSMWQFIPQKSAGFVSNMGELHGIKGISPSRRIELLPYTVGQTQFSQADPDDPFESGRDGRFTGGLDGKVGITSDLTMDFTVNPDFGQVEADPSEVNLTAFETFFEEKRPFFIEGKNIFNYALGWGGGSFSRETLFYSRRIGRRPQHDPELDDDEYSKVPENTSIITAAKITGKTKSGFSVGVLDAVTAREYAKIDRNGQVQKEEVEPLTNYFVGRLQKDFDKGNTNIGGMITALHRDLNAPDLNFLNKAAYSGGLDFSHQWHNKDYIFAVKTAYSRIEGSPEAILEAQTASQRYFQRPDASHVTLDSSRTSLTGHGGSFIAGRMGGGHWRYVLGGIWRSPGFETNDLGFLRNADRGMGYTWIAYREWDPRWIFRNYQINFNLWSGWNFAGERLYTGGNINGGGRLKNYWRFWIGINREGAELRDNELRGGPMMAFPGAWNSWFNINTDDRKIFRFRVNGFNSFKDDKITRQHKLLLDITWRPDNALALSAEPFFQYNKDNLQYVETIEPGDDETQSLTENRYILGLIEQKTFGIQFRANFSITPTLSIQYYGQPFISAGNYSQFKNVTEPRAQNYNDRFHVFQNDQISVETDDGGNRLYQIDENSDGSIVYSFEDPNFNFWQFRSNLVIRWEYTVGSTLYLVWTQNRTDDSSAGVFSLNDDFKNLFSIYPDNVFLIKLNYWFSL
jgi:hypothetical protein